jgi:hypothetical protein
MMSSNQIPPDVNSYHVQAPTRDPVRGILNDATSFFWRPLYQYPASPHNPEVLDPSDIARSKADEAGS